MPVAAPATAAVGDHRALSRAPEIPAIAPLWVFDDRARRHAYLEGLRRGAVLARALAVTAALCLEVGAATKGRQVSQRGIADEHDIASAPAVAPVRSALRHVRLTAEGDDAVTAIAAPHVDARSIVEHARGLL